MELKNASGRITPASANVLLLGSAAAWGAAYVVGHYGLSDGSAAFLTLWRWGPSAVVFLFVASRSMSRYAALVRNNLGPLVLLSALGVVIYPLTLFLAVSETTALNSSLYLAVTPAVIMIGSRALYGVPIGRLGSLSIVIGLVGTAVILFRGDLGLLRSLSIDWSDKWAIVSALAWAGYVISLEKKPSDLTETQFLGATVVIGVAIVIPVALLDIGSGVPVPNNARTAWSMLFFAVVPSVLAFLAWNSAVGFVGPSRASVYNNLVPLFGGLFGVLLLSEQIEAFHLVGGALIVVSLIVNARRA